LVHNDNIKMNFKIMEKKKKKKNPPYAFLQIYIDTVLYNKIIPVRSG
jgi:hypothetical protein